MCRKASVTMTTGNHELSCINIAALQQYNMFNIVMKRFISLFFACFKIRRYNIVDIHVAHLYVTFQKKSFQNQAEITCIISCCKQLMQLILV